VTSHPFTVRLKDASVTVRCHRLAAHEGVVRYALLSGDHEQLTAARDLMREKGLVSCDGQTYVGTYLPTIAQKRVGDAGQYSTWVIALRDQSSKYLWSGTSDELYLSLLENYTTPLLPEWMVHLADTLVMKRHLQGLGKIGACCGFHLDVTQDQLDEIVSAGLKTKRILIPKESV
jgi:hypothetical protein